MAALLTLLICSVTWATTVSVRATTPVSDDGQHPVTPESDFITLTCIPVKVDIGVDCISTTYLRNDNVPTYAEYWDKVICRVNLYLPNFILTNECQEVGTVDPDLISCIGKIPRHLKHIAYCQMIGGTTSWLSSIIAPHTCNGVCEVYNDGVGCVVNEECRLCNEDLKKYLPQYANDTSICEKGL
ncbi:uncharacterized protein LOC143027467 [Oratosquilla oratoria]|uniref:uncharacterized protein LOC143027467 n=1 Tax=Oratosquilla oratoria TaxID=337810 RepID=UPI003F7703BD